MTNSFPLFMSPCAMPGESPFSRRVTLTQTLSLVDKRGPPLWLLQSLRPALSPSSPPSTSSPEPGVSSKCFPRLKAPSVRNAGGSATSPIAVTAHYPFVPSTCSPTPKQTIAALTLPALRVAISNLSSPAVYPRWHAALTAKRSILRAAGIVPPT